MPKPLPQWAELRCPATGSALRREEGELVGQDGGPRYPLVQDVPVMIDSAQGAFDPADYGGGSLDGSPVSSTRGLPYRIAVWQAPITRNVASARNFRRVYELLKPGEREEPARVIVIGGRVMGYGSDQVLDQPGVESVETDVLLGPRTQIICDAMAVPFADDTFDAAVIQGVLDCVPDPHKAVAELHRVLKPGGVIYSEVCFLMPQHDAAHDFWRFTLQGHRRLMRCFDEIDAGVQVGPGSALAASVRAFARNLAGPSRLLRIAFGRIAALFCVWMPRLDDYFVKHPAAVDSSFGNYFLGRRRDEPISDREILERYDGAQADPYPKVLR